ncbi:hypothetical protein MNEG_11928 [Monoraphidium neglectum]|uniref:Protein kinase domain-containing protein n=1 Tax=Monoraphidium neglectum TaxID=145388 RepID=A0A0D2KJL8_9CHLO|nr:hypothetical protein MNEG_11928 [Monoraphidium neglectum]KIY96033.1 hypothetical protein MNEG_11928 [Monoraphidium neglectum]|eukprot:XP_013895053.1 hypothetical protein MNEG_11928 [Monoraphidium neglectum]
MEESLFRQLYSRNEPGLARLPGSYFRERLELMKGSLDGSAYVGSMVLPDGRAVVVKGFKKDGAACWADLSMAKAEIDAHEELGPRLLYPFHVPRLLAVCEDNKTAHLVFEHGGRPFRQACRELSPAEVLEVCRAVVRDVAPLLVLLHDEGWCYSDLKSDQLLLRRRPDGGWVVPLIDFGGLRRTHSSSAAAFTAKWAAPEAGPAVLRQLYGMEQDSCALAAVMGPAYDTWALGAILAEALAGAHPWDVPAPRDGGDGDNDDEYEAAVVRRIMDDPLAYRRAPAVHGAPACLRDFLDGALEPDPAARATCLELCFSEFGEAAGALDPLDWVPQVREALPLMTALAERRGARGTEALAAAAAAHAAEVAALSAGAAGREAALQGRVAVLEAAAREAAAWEQLKDKAATAAAATHAALVDENAVLKAQVAALQARLAELKGAGRAAVAAAAATSGTSGSWGGSVRGASRTSSVCSGDDGGLCAELLVLRPASPRLSLDGGSEVEAEQEQKDKKESCTMAPGTVAEAVTKAAAEGCGELHTASRASSRSVSPSTSQFAETPADTDTEAGCGSCTGTSIAAPVVGAMKPCVIARVAAACSTTDSDRASTRGDAFASLDAASGCEADAAAVIAVVSLNSSNDGASSKKLQPKSGGAKHPYVGLGRCDVRTPVERVQGAAHKLRKEAGKAAALFKGLLCVRAHAGR